MAKLAMRTHAVPAYASANGSASSATPTSAMPSQTRAGVLTMASCAVSHPLAKQALRAEHEHQDQHDESEHILVVGPEQDEMAAVGAALAEQIGQPAVAAKVGEVADVAGAQRLDQSEQQSAEHGARNIPDAAEHGGGKCLQAEDRSHGVLRDPVIGAEEHAGDGAERGADDEGGGDHAVDIDAHQPGHLRILRGSAHSRAERRAIDE